MRIEAKVWSRRLHTLAFWILVSLGMLLPLAGCQESAPTGLPTGTLPSSAKGYELYSWRSGKAWRYTLVTGSNRRKTVAEVTSGENEIDGEWIKITVEGVPALATLLDLLPAETVVFWTVPDLPSGWAAPWVRLALPPESTIEAMREHCAQQRVRLDVLR